MAPWVMSLGFMTRATCDALNLPPGSTYAQAARRVREGQSGTGEGRE